MSCWREKQVQGWEWRPQADIIRETIKMPGMADASRIFSMGQDDFQMTIDKAADAIREETDRDDWFVAQLRPGGLARAVINLNRQGFATFAPWRATRRQLRGRWTDQKAPLFPGYVFVRFEQAAENWRVINNTFGVARLLVQDIRRPAPLPRALIEALHARCDSHHSLQPVEQLAVGDRVRILSGPFAEFVTRIEEIEDAARVRVLLQVLGGQVMSSLDARIIAREKS